MRFQLNQPLLTARFFGGEAFHIDSCLHYFETRPEKKKHSQMVGWKVLFWVDEYLPRWLLGCLWTVDGIRSWGSFSVLTKCAINKVLKQRVLEVPTNNNIFLTKVKHTSSSWKHFSIVNSQPKKEKRIYIFQRHGTPLPLLVDLCLTVSSRAHCHLH